MKRRRLVKRVCVFCASGTSVPEYQIVFAEKFGNALGKAGFDLVWGGASLASMGAVARGVQASGGKAIGVILRSMVKQGWNYRDADKLIVVADLFERKRRMKELADAFVALPGGIGTLDEFINMLGDQIVEALDGIQPKKLIALSYRGFYNNLERLLEGFIAGGMADPAYRRLYRITRGIKETVSLLKTEQE